jgi:hypothetical protein
MTISVRVALAGDIVRLNRDVQQLHAELEPSFFKSNFDNDRRTRPEEGPTFKVAY